MKTKLMKTKDYLFLIDLEYKVKEGDTWVFDIDSKSIIPILGNTQIVKEGILKNWFVKILAYYPLLNEVQQLDGLLFLPNPFEIDIENLAKSQEGCSQETCQTIDEQYKYILGFMEGYKASNQKKFTQEDMINAARYGYEFRDTTSFPKHKFEDGCINNFKQYIQSKYKQNFPKDFLPLCIKDIIQVKTFTNNKIECYGKYIY